MAGVQECFNCAGFASSMAGTAFSMAGYGRYGRRKKMNRPGISLEFGSMLRHAAMYYRLLGYWSSNRKWRKKGQLGWPNTGWSSWKRQGKGIAARFSCINVLVMSNLPYDLYGSFFASFMGLYLIASTVNDYPRIFDYPMVYDHPMVYDYHWDWWCFTVNFSALSLAGWRIIPQISATGNTPLDFRGSRFSDIEPRSQWLVCCYATALFAGIPIAKVDIHK